MHTEGAIRFFDLVPRFGQSRAMHATSSPPRKAEDQGEGPRGWSVGAGIDELEAGLWAADRRRQEQVRTIRASRPAAAPYRVQRPDRGRLPEPPSFERRAARYMDCAAIPRRVAHQHDTHAAFRIADDERA
jgi:hypothetical protein